MSKKRDATARLEDEVARFRSDLSRFDEVAQKRIKRLERETAKLRAEVVHIVGVQPAPTSVGGVEPVNAETGNCSERVHIPHDASPHPPARRRMPRRIADESPARKAVANWPSAIASPAFGLRSQSRETSGISRRTG